ncbi:aldehyde dehydrogenase family protein [Variovorax terrae]|uniref:4-(hydroxymethyl)benzenesulfonate dehydrogenase n=1 Tax=Variovorax terrae TaxID=2923278 RepID=A0A9X2AT51_9BURK|nr:aldehyde dehydrogenase family protein [Variovorax terrae]MCJ0766011.1 aldehyde dehydrogenase family protein [Variovorax terrae]
MKLNDLTQQHLRSLGLLDRGRLGNWIDGVEVAPHDGGYLPVRDPATELLVAEVADSRAADIDRAVQAARRAFDNGAWTGLRPAERERLLCRLADLIEAHGDELAALETLETGKLLGIARAIDVGAGAEHVRYMAGWATKIEGSTLDTSIGVPPGTRYHAYTQREPAGVVAAVVPWNFPLAIALWKVAPALACGCTVVLKPAPETPLTALRLAQLAQEAGLPAGVLNVVTGGGEAGAALVAHPGVDKISFTGSTAVGKAIGHTALDRMARFTLELGGKSPMIVLDDMDPERAAQGAAMGIFFNQGQVCTAGSRVYVQRARYAQMLEALAAQAAQLRIGSGFDPQTQIGPLVSQRQLDRVMAYVDGARAEGARLVAGGRRALDGGYFVQPTVFADTAPDQRIVREEIFGPVVAVMPFDDEDEALALANDTPYGLAASVWSNDLSRVHRVVPRLKAGIVWVNTHNMLDNNLPFGGHKQSGYGRDLGRAAIEQYTELKSVCIAY